MRCNLLPSMMLSSIQSSPKGGEHWRIVDSVQDGITHRILPKITKQKFEQSDLIYTLDKQIKFELSSIFYVMLSITKYHLIFFTII